MHIHLLRGILRSNYLEQGPTTNYTIIFLNFLFLCIALFTYTIVDAMNIGAKGHV